MGMLSDLHVFCGRYGSAHCGSGTGNVGRIAFNHVQLL